LPPGIKPANPLRHRPRCAPVAAYRRPVRHYRPRHLPSRTGTQRNRVPVWRKRTTPYAESKVRRSRCAAVDRTIRRTRIHRRRTTQPANFRASFRPEIPARSALPQIAEMPMTPTPLKKRGGSAGRNAAQSAARKTDHLLNSLLIAVRVRARHEKRKECGTGSYHKNGRSAASTPDQVRRAMRHQVRGEERLEAPAAARARSALGGAAAAGAGTRGACRRPRFPPARGN
jgi:hypothetical protein